MGWWSATVMGGDTPLDCLGDMVERIGGQFDPDFEPAEGSDFVNDNCWVYSRQMVEDGMGALVKYCSQSSSWAGDISWQVLGHMVLTTGAALPEEAMALIIEAAKNDEWAREGNEERISCMEALVEAIQAHQPVSGRA